MMRHEALIDFMYQIMGGISRLDAPIVFKGHLITKLILAEERYTGLARPTIDMDASWVGAPPSMEDLAAIVNQSLQTFSGDLYRAKAIREYGDTKSAGIAVVEAATGDRVFAMDISMKPVHSSRVYHYGEISVRGVLANEILSDKLTVMSKRLIFRRAKDIVDVYALAHCVNVHTAEIFDMFRKHPDREIGVFDEFYDRRDDVAHAYGRLKGVEGKPPFDDVYSYLSKFVRPFAHRDETPQVWKSDKQAWEEI